MSSKITKLLVATTLAFAPLASNAQAIIQAVNDNATVVAGNSVTINVLNNDVDPLGQAYMSRYTEPNVGMLVKNANNTFTYTAPAGYTGTVEFAYTLRACNLTVAPVGHFYQYVPAQGISWTDARDSAENMTFNGMQGYLATIMSPAENLLVQAVAVNGAQGWIGGSDEEQEGYWKWVTGPEAGEHFSDQDTTFTNSPITPQLPCKYHNWAILEPNEQAGMEDYLQFRGYNGSWNDMRNELNPPDMDGFYVEFGGMENNSIPNTSTATVTIIVTNGCTQANPTITVTPSSTTYTGGNPKNIYIGYGPQSVTLKAKVDNTTTGYTFSWSPASKLTNANTANATFTPTAAGTYTFTVTATKNGCATSSTVTICVKDVRVPYYSYGCGGSYSGYSNKVYVCYNSPCGGPTTYKVDKSDVACYLNYYGSAIKLGKCSSTCGSSSSSSRMAEEEYEEVMDIADAFQMEVYPNPTEGVFNVKFPYNNVDIDVRVIDVTGRVVDQRKITNVDQRDVRFDYSNQPKGIYMIQATDGAMKLNSKVIVR